MTTASDYESQYKTNAIRRVEEEYGRPTEEDRMGLLALARAWRATHPGVDRDKAAGRVWAAATEMVGDVENGVLVSWAVEQTRPAPQA